MREKRVRAVPRVHAAFMEPASEAVEHAASAGGGGALCGVTEGEIYRHVFEDVARSKTCPVCQALSDAVRAADLLGAVAEAVDRQDVKMDEPARAALATLQVSLLAVYGPEPVRPEVKAEVGAEVTENA